LPREAIVWIVGAFVGAERGVDALSPFWNAVGGEAGPPELQAVEQGSTSTLV